MGSSVQFPGSSSRQAATLLQASQPIAVSEYTGRPDGTQCRFNPLNCPARRAKRRLAPTETKFGLQLFNRLNCR